MDGRDQQSRREYQRSRVRGRGVVGGVVGSRVQRKLCEGMGVEGGGRLCEGEQQLLGAAGQTPCQFCDPQPGHSALTVGDLISSRLHLSGSV